MSKTQTAQLKYLRMTPRKVRAVADLMRGLTVNEAEAQLLLIRRRAAKPLLKLLRSAVAGVRNERKMDADKLTVSSVFVDQGPMLKRALPRARGVASPIQKKMSHVTLVLEENSDIVKRFDIVVKKKVKLPDGEKRHKKVARKTSGEITVKPKENPGFFRRVFSRKSISK